MRHRQEGKIVLVRSSTGKFDVIYAGILSIVGDMLYIDRAVNVVKYEKTAVAGLSGNPQMAKRLRHTFGPCEWSCPLSSVQGITACVQEVWEPYLSVIGAEPVVEDD